MRILLLLLLINAIKIPSNAVPVFHIEEGIYTGIATPWFIVVKDEHEIVVEHQRCHVRQMNVYGSLWWWAINAYYNHAYGYVSNPFEVYCYNLERGE